MDTEDFFTAFFSTENCLPTNILMTTRAIKLTEINWSGIFRPTTSLEVSAFLLISAPYLY